MKKLRESSQWIRGIITLTWSSELVKFIKDLASSRDVTFLIEFTFTQSNLAFFTININDIVAGLESQFVPYPEKYNSFFYWLQFKSRFFCRALSYMYV